MAVAAATGAMMKTPSAITERRKRHNDHFSVAAINDVIFNGSFIIFSGWRRHIFDCLPVEIGALGFVKSLILRINPS